MGGDPELVTVGVGEPDAVEDGDGVPEPVGAALGVVETDGVGVAVGVAVGFLAGPEPFETGLNRGRCPSSSVSSGADVEVSLLLVRIDPQIWPPAWTPGGSWETSMLAGTGTQYWC